MLNPPSTDVHAPGQQALPGAVRATLGDVLYGDKSGPLVLEGEWTALVQRIAAGDQLALHGLYDRTHHLVFALILRITGKRETAEELTPDVFLEAWRGAPRFDAAAPGMVLGWVMNLARARAIDRLRFDQRQKRGHRDIDGEAAELGPSDWPDDWPSDVQRPPSSLRRRLAVRIAQETGGELVLPDPSPWKEPEWKEVAPGISCKLLSTDGSKNVVGMLVRLAPNGEYPPHSHAGTEELHLLDGELWIDERKLHPGDYNRAEARTSDKRVWSETGCTCVLITSTEDVLG